MIIGRSYDLVEAISGAIVFVIVNKIEIMDMVLNATFKNISVISWGSVLLVEETGVPSVNNFPIRTLKEVHSMKSLEKYGFTPLNGGMVSQKSED
jgi:hypothetical protein